MFLLPPPPQPNPAHLSSCVRLAPPTLPCTHPYGPLPLPFFLLAPLSFTAVSVLPVLYDPFQLPSPYICSTFPAPSFPPKVHLPRLSLIRLYFLTPLFCFWREMLRDAFLGMPLLCLSQQICIDLSCITGQCSRLFPGFPLLKYDLIPPILQI